MDRQKITVCELFDQLRAEAGRISASGLDEEKRDRLAAIRRRIDEIRIALGLSDA